MAKEIRYGLVEGPGKGREYKVAASQYFGRRGGKFVYLVKGKVTRCATGVAIVMGWAETPKDAAGKNAWKSSATAGKDSVFVISGLENTFEMPCNETVASLKNANATYLGQGCGIVISGATYAEIQKAKIGGSITASPLTIVDYDVDKHTVRVKIKPAKLQAL